MTEAQFDSFLEKHFERIPEINKNTRQLLSREIKSEAMHFDWPDMTVGVFNFITTPKIRYVIKNEDLPIFESLFDGLKTAAGADFFMKASTGDINSIWAAAIGIFSSLFKLYKNIRNKGKILPVLQFHILVCLKNYPEGAELGFLKMMLEPLNINLRERELEKELDKLMEIYTDDGSKKQFVIKDGNLYKTAGI